MTLAFITNTSNTTYYSKADACKRYQTLGPHWSATMLSLIEFAMIPIPVVFYLYGHKIREKSTLIKQMREDREKLDSKKSRAAERLRAAGAEGKKMDV